MLKYISFLLVVLLFACVDSSDLDERLSINEIIEKGELTIKDDGTVIYEMNGETWENYQDLIHGLLDEFEENVEQKVAATFSAYSIKEGNEKHCWAAAYKFQNNYPCGFTLQYGWASTGINIQQNCSSSGFYAPYLGITNCTNICKIVSSPYQCVNGGNLICTDSESGFHSGFTTIIATGSYGPGISCSANVTIN